MGWTSERSRPHLSICRQLVWRTCVTPYAAECAALQAQPRWAYEGIAFYLMLPDENGDCPRGTTTLYRLYNQSNVAPPFARGAYIGESHCTVSPRAHQRSTKCLPRAGTPKVIAELCVCMHCCRLVFAVFCPRKEAVQSFLPRIKPTTTAT
jgi:hypothetical protein